MVHKTDLEASQSYVQNLRITHKQTNQEIEKQINKISDQRTAEYIHNNDAVTKPKESYINKYIINNKQIQNYAEVTSGNVTFIQGYTTYTLIHCNTQSFLTLQQIIFPASVTTLSNNYEDV